MVGAVSQRFLRYVDSRITDEAGMLLPEWKSLIVDYSDRLMLRSDPVWPVEQLHPWDQPNTGWEKNWNILVSSCRLVKTTAHGNGQ